MKPSNYIRLLGREVYYEKYQASQSPSQYCFLLIHGFLACTYTFHRIIPHLSSKYDTYCIDLIGFGNSEKPADFDYSYDSYAAIVLEFIKTMGLKNVILLGHSMGGQVSLYTAKQSPRMIHSLVLVCCSGYVGRTEALMKYVSYLPLSKSFLNWWIRHQDPKVILRTTLFNEKFMTQEMIETYSKPVSEKRFCNTLIGLLRNREGDLYGEALHSISHPVLIIWGEEDEIVPLKAGVRLGMDIPTSELIVIPEAGHQVIEEKPDEVYKEIERWLLKN